jgi:hypothetical protein
MALVWSAADAPGTVRRDDAEDVVRGDGDGVVDVDTDSYYEADFSHLPEAEDGPETGHVRAQFDGEIDLEWWDDDWVSDPVASQNA